MIDLGNKIRQLRCEKKMTQKQLAERVGVSKAMVSSYELTSRYPSFDTLIKISRVFSVSTDFLLGLEKNCTIDISGMTNSQICILNSLIDEFKKR